jgi:hypothetical protein
MSEIHLISSWGLTEEMGDDRPKTRDDDSGAQTTEKEVLVTEYQEVREELRENARLLHMRISRGIAAIGAVIGYALLAEEGSVFITIIPLIIGIVYLLTLNSIQNMLLLGRYSYDIEEKIMPEGEGWEHQYGGLLPHGERETTLSKFPRIDLSDISSIIVGGLSAFIYAGFIYLSWREINELKKVAGLDPAVLFVMFHFTLTISLAAATMAYRMVFNILQPEDI